MRDAQQKKGIRNTIITILIIITITLGLFFHKILTPRVLSVDELRANGVVLFEPARAVNDFSLTDQRGQVFTKASLREKWTLAFFGFTHCPDICPTTLAQLARLYKELGPALQRKTQVVLVTLDPDRDTRDQLSAYLSYFNEDFIGVRGEMSEIDKLAKSVYVVHRKVELGESYSVDHSGNIILINPNGKYQGFIKPPFQLARLKSALISIDARYE